MKNKGISYRFYLKEGKFSWVEGSERVSDQLSFFTLFDTVKRIYYADYTPGLLTLVQKGTSYLYQYKQLILGRLEAAINKYVPLIQVKNKDLQYRVGDPDKKVALVIDFRVKETNEEVQQLVRFI